MARKPADQSVNRDEIIAAAADVLSRRGYETATMKDIAAAVNLTAASLYHHFRNKDALLLAVLEMGLEFAIRRIEPLACRKPASAEDRLRSMMREHIVSVANNPAVGAAMVFEIHALSNAKPPGKRAKPEDVQAFDAFLAQRDAFFKRRDTFEHLFRSVVQEGVSSGEFHSVDVPIFVKALLGANNWVGVWYRPDGRLSGEAIAAEITGYFLSALLKPGQ
ncbi:MAG: TetR family transcriptional regulator [Chloroflexi bacterium]|nr:TetR family transcriptional regulator [Chloroflexota bacterium]